MFKQVKQEDAHIYSDGSVRGREPPDVEFRAEVSDFQPRTSQNSENIGWFCLILFTNCIGEDRTNTELHHVNAATVPQSSYPDPYIPALNNLWCHTGNKQPEEQRKKKKSRRQYGALGFSDVSDNEERDSFAFIFKIL